jgi:hypothetical protein
MKTANSSYKKHPTLELSLRIVQELGVLLYDSVRSIPLLHFTFWLQQLLLGCVWHIKLVGKKRQKTIFLRSANYRTWINSKQFGVIKEGLDRSNGKVI